jgi:hypothetical protein
VNDDDGLLERMRLEAAAFAPLKIGGPGPAVRPPSRPNNETAGWLGYYCKSHLPAEFDLVDIDGSDPTCWLYFKSALKIFRVIEEKPNGQDIHPSQNRCYEVILDLIDAGIKAGKIHPSSGVYIIWNAQQLRVPIFPISVMRIGIVGLVWKEVRLTREQFDCWLRRGLS